MSICKCKMCGGALEINNNETVATCEYCGTQQTLPKQDDEKRSQIYDRANHFRRNNEYDKAMQMYEKIPNEEREAESRHLERERQFKEEWLKRERKKRETGIRGKRIKKITAIVTLIACAIIVFVITLNRVIIPNIKYNNAVVLIETGEYLRAYEVLTSLDGYKDSAEKANSIYGKYKIEKLKQAKVGEYFFFGSYEQDNNTANGKEEIEWLVLEKQADKVLVISKYALDCQPYNTRTTDITWETCTLRPWLNNDFFRAAFSEAEKAMIPTVTVSADANPEYDTDPGNATQDKVFLMSIPEVNRYFNSDRAKACRTTDYAEARGAYISSSNGNCKWWLRSPALVQYHATGVDSDGVVYGHEYDLDHAHMAVRPALWISLNA